MAKPVILCVDDEKTVLNGLRDELKYEFGKDFAIELAESGEEGLALVEDLLAEGTVIPVIVSDQIMPGMKGDEFLIAMHHRLPYTRKVLLTGQASPESVGNLVNHGALYRFISKPWEPKHLFEVLQEAIREYYHDIHHKEDEAAQARRMQRAMMTDPEILTRFFPASHICYRPGEPLAGDFYWFAEREGQFFLCLGDAGGGGIPGAYFTALGISALNFVLMYGTHNEAAEFLTGFSRRIAPQLLEIAQGAGSGTGMKVAFCKIDPKAKKLAYAGAGQDAFVLRAGTWLPLKGDDDALSFEDHSSRTKFPTNEITYQAGDRLFIFSDSISRQANLKGETLSVSKVQEKIAAMAELPMPALGLQLETLIDAWIAQPVPNDDILCIGIEL